MKRWLGSLFVLASLILATPSFAANTSVPNMTAAGSVVGTDLWYCAQSAGTLDRKCTSAQFAAYVNSLFSQDCTVNSTGTVTCLKTNNVAFTALATTAPGTGVATALGVNVGTAGSFVVNGGALGTPSSGVATNLTGTAAGLTAGNVTTNANLTGAITSVGNAASLGSFSSAQLLAALSTKTGTGSSVFGTAPTIDSLNATTAMTLAFLTGGGTQCLQVSNTGVVSATGAVCGGSGASGANPTATAGPAAVNGVAATFMRSDAAPPVQKASNAQFGIMEGDGSTVTCVAGVCTAVPGVTSRTVSSGPDTILSTDRGNVVYYNSASAIAISQPVPSGSFASGFFTTLCNISTGTPTITPGSGTIDGGATYAIPAGTAASPSCISYQSDGSIFNAVDLQASFGSNVQAALGKALSAAGGVTSTIASGTAALGTGAISSATCATVVTVSATNVATTDVVSASFNGDPTAVTGYIPATAGMLTIIGYPTSGNVNFKVCNLTTGSITPGAITLNWRVVR